MQALLFISGIGIFLLAMREMEHGLTKLGSKALHHSLQSFTRTPLHGIALGIIATAIFQSSSIIGLITLAFVGAGIIKLKNAIGIILGSNLGTTFTGWVVTVIGFKLNLAEFYLPIMGLGAIGISLMSSFTKGKQLGRLIFAFGLLIMGLALMKDSIIFIVDLIDIQKLSTLPLFAFFILGILLTALIQSSSATMMIALSAINAGVIELPAAAALIVGADLGTTSTIIIGSLQGSEVKKQVALIHVSFNFLVDTLALLALPFLLTLVTQIFGIEDALFGLVAFHSSFNLVGILLFLPFIKRLQKVAEKTFPIQKKMPLYISKVSVKVPEAAFEALEKDINKLILTALYLNERRLSLTHSISSPELMQELQRKPTQNIYLNMKKNENNLTDYLLELQREPLSIEQSARAQQLLVCIRDTLYASKAMKDIQQDLEAFEQFESKKAKQAITQLISICKNFYHESTSLCTEEHDDKIEKLSELLTMVSDAHSQLNADIYTLIDEQQFKKEEASTAFNINREVLLSGHSIINVLENYLLAREQAQTLSEILKIER